MTFPLLGSLAAYSYVLPVTAGFVQFRRMHSKKKYFFLYCILNMVGVAVEVIISDFGVNNHLFINILQLIEIEFFCALCYTWFISKKFQTLAIILMVFFVIVYIVSSINFHEVKNFNTVGLSSANMIRMILSALVLFEVIHVQTIPFRQNSLFWISSGLFVYSVGIFMIHLLSNWLLEQGLAFFDFVWHINWSLCIACNLFLSVSFFVRER